MYICIMRKLAKILLLFRPGSSVAETFKEIFEFENLYHVTMMDNPILLLKNLKENPSQYDVIFLEVRMPIMDGVETLERLKAMNINTPILITSFHMHDKQGKKLEKKGAFKYVSSPCDLMELLSTVKEAVAANKVS